jgi:Raf kinase inhibitor-like YbhB/YbcL family protein
VDKEQKMRSWMTSTVFILAIGACTHVPGALAQSKPGLSLSTNAFEDGGIIPNKYTAAAEGTPVSPKLVWTNVPDGTVSFTLIVRDVDTSVMKTTTEILHWMVLNIPATTRELPEGVQAQTQLPAGAIQARNQRDTIGYMGMGARAPGPYHHYTFELFALDTKLELGANATQADVLKAMDGHVLAKGVVVGRFHRP